MKPIVPTPYEMQQIGSAEIALLNYWIEQLREMYTAYGLGILSVAKTIKVSDQQLNKVVSSLRGRLWRVVEFELASDDSMSLLAPAERQKPEKLYLVAPSFQLQILLPLDTPHWNVGGQRVQSLRAKLEDMNVTVRLSKEILEIDFNRPAE